MTALFFDLLPFLRQPTMQRVCLHANTEGWQQGDQPMGCMDRLCHKLLLHFSCCTYAHPTHHPPKRAWSTRVMHVPTMFQANAEVRAAGMVINTMGWVDVLGYELLLHSIATLRADVVLVVGQDRLYSQLSSELRCGRISAPLLALPCVHLSSCWLLFRAECDDPLSSKLQCTLCGQLGSKRAPESAWCGGVFPSLHLSAFLAQEP